MKTLTLRKALNDDALMVAEVYIRSRRAAIPFIPPYVHTDDEVREWISSIVIPIQDTWVAETEDREIVAMISLENGWIDQSIVRRSRVGWARDRVIYDSVGKRTIS